MQRHGRERLSARDDVEPRFFGYLRLSRQRILDREYKRDSRGRFGSGGGGSEIRQELADAKTNFAVSQIVQDQASGIVGDKVDVRLDNLDLGVAKEVGEGLLRGFEAYPASPLREVGTFSAQQPGNGAGRLAKRLAGDPNLLEVRAVAIRGGETDGRGKTYDQPGAQFPNGNHGSGTAVYFNIDHATPEGYARAQEDRAAYERLKAEGRIEGAPGTISVTPMSTALHEFGHATGYHGRPDQPEYMVKQAADKIAARDGVAPSKVAARVSIYATTDHAELAAEAFADVMANGDKASPTSHELMAAYDEGARGWQAAVAPKATNRAPRFFARLAYDRQRRSS